MLGELRDPHWQFHKSFENQSSKTTAMEARVRKTVFSPLRRITEQHELSSSEDREYPNRSFSSTHGKNKASRSSYFSLESMLLLFCLTVSLLILPLVLPPLPPPPFLLLLLPIAILALLMILALMPSNVRDFTNYTYV